MVVVVKATRVFKYSVKGFSNKCIADEKMSFIVFLHSQYLCHHHFAATFKVQINFYLLQFDAHVNTYSSQTDDEKDMIYKQFTDKNLSKSLCQHMMCRGLHSQTNVHKCQSIFDPLILLFFLHIINKYEV